VLLPGDEEHDNRIEVCGQRCEIDASASDATQATCVVPPIATAYSADNFEIVTADNVFTHTEAVTASAMDQLANLFDGNNLNDYVDSSASCFVEAQFKDSYVGVLDSIKFFINNLYDNAPFVGNLVLQGSNDGSTYDDLWTVDANIHEGWNQMTWEEGTKPAYNRYRFSGSASGACRMGEISGQGVIAIDDNNDSYSCPVNVIVQGDTTAANAVTVSAASTPVLTEISPRFGSVLGGETITFSGTGFSDSATITVTLDDKDCSVTSQTSTSVSCVTSSRADTLNAPSMRIYIDGVGDVATKGQVFRYVKRWSDPETWGGDAPPLEGEAVYIPSGMHLLVDVDSTPILSFLTVEGSLIFAPDADPEHQRTFDAKYVMVRGGYFEAGTNEYPYTSKLTITMHSTVDDPYLPIYGNKVIGVRFGQIELHGVHRPITWTDLKSTAEVGATEIVLNDMNGETLDWQVGEKIVIASTDFVGRHAEQREIVAITDLGTNPRITLDSPLEYKHFAGVETVGTGADDWIEMRAEVGLLTRNLKFQGNPEDSAENQYGGHIMIHSPGDESCIGRIENTEFFNVGQAFKLGRYPIHFHMIGTVHKSYVRNNAIW
jgi:hypothetical protein